MEVRAIAKHVTISPRKVRPVLEHIRGKPVSQAMAILRFMPNKAARIVAKVVKSAAANAENNFEMSPEKLYIVRAYADDGPRLKRWMPRARGRVDMIQKRMSHITVVVDEKEG